LLFLFLSVSDCDDSFRWISLKLDEVCENLACISMLHAEDKTMLITIVHSIVASLGILFITAFLFTEVHFIAIVRWSYLHTVICNPFFLLLIE